MMDFLKMYPAFTMHDYIWGISAPMIKIMTSDATQVICLTTDEQKEEYKRWKRRHDATLMDNLDDAASALRLPKKKKLKK